MTITGGLTGPVATDEQPVESPAQLPRWLPDFAGVAFVIVAAALAMAPAVSHGWSLGPYDQLLKFGVTQRPGAIVHNTQVYDLIREIIPWTTLSWMQVHHGVLPLWNPYSALGAPLAFNWQSGAFSLPALLGYLTPLRLTYTVQVLITLVIGGTGTYALSRIMGLGAIGATMAGTTFELGGSFFAILGWPIAAVMSWSGWIFACAILVIRGKHRRRDIALFGLVLALAVYAGEPDTLVVLLVGLGVFVTAILVQRVRKFQLREAVGRPLLDIALGSAVGVGLAAPLILPGSQLLSGAVRATSHHDVFPAYQIINLVFATFDGSSLAGSRSFEPPGLGLVSTADYMGVIPLVLAVVALITVRRRTAVNALGAVAIVGYLLTYFSPLVSVLNAFPKLAQVRWDRGIQLLGLSLAVLAGVGLDKLVRADNDRAVRRWLGAGFGGMALLLLFILGFERGNLSPVDATIRTRSFIWPGIEVIIGMAVVSLLVLTASRRRTRDSRSGWSANPGLISGVVLLISSTVLLLVIDAPWWSATTTFLSPTATESQLQKAVGTSILGFGTSSCEFPPTVGILPNVNIVYGLHELDTYEPMTPRKLYSAWKESTGHGAVPIGASGFPAALPTMFCPVIENAASARLFGVGFVLEKPGAKGPPGSVFDMKIGHEGLYRIPGAAVATLTPAPSKKSLPTNRAPGKPVQVTYPNSMSWRMVTRSTTPQVLRLRLIDVPGWHASIDGKPLQLLAFNGAMLQARIPAGTHSIELHYWPDTFTLGIVLAGSTVAILAAVAVFGRIRVRKRALHVSGGSDGAEQ